MARLTIACAPCRRTELQEPHLRSPDNSITRCASDGAPMTQFFASSRRPQPRATTTLVFASALLLASSLAGAASAQSLGYAPQDRSAFPQGYVSNDAAVESEDSVLPDRLRRQVVNF